MEASEGGPPTTHSRSSASQAAWQGYLTCAQGSRDSASQQDFTLPRGLVRVSATVQQCKLKPGDPQEGDLPPLTRRSCLQQGVDGFDKVLMADMRHTCKGNEGAGQDVGTSGVGLRYKLTLAVSLVSSSHLGQQQAQHRSLLLLPHTMKPKQCFFDFPSHVASVAGTAAQNCIVQAQHSAAQSPTSLETSLQPQILQLHWLSTKGGAQGIKLAYRTVVVIIESIPFQANYCFKPSHITVPVISLS
eukprot:scaffold25659_cov18-Tisochrysis_lutea.AAC.2